MPLTVGTRLGPYEITASLGAGGMGEVYRARDTRLARDVAIKILPDAFVHDAERLARFQLEAQVLASLNHPNIGAIYGLEESGSGRALVLEFVDGPTLADRIGQPLTVDEALPIARQIADALAAAHAQGVIHRDLKPANVKVRPDGLVKVLDFGLAKLVEVAGAREAGGVVRAGGAGELAMSQSPTITSPTMMTGIGVLLGTAAYMSPEQAKGRPADTRSDLWAFGCVLYEMLAGRRAFEGEDISDTLANVLKMSPDWNALPAEVPQAIHVLLRRCLEKDRQRRVADAAVALFAFDQVEMGRVQPQAPAGTGSREDDAAYIPRDTAAAQTTAAVSDAQREMGRSTRRRIAIVGSAALVVGATLGIAVWHSTRSPQAPPRVERFTIASTGRAAPSIGGNSRDLVITPDGTRVIYVGSNGTQLFVRALDELDPTAIATGAPRGPFVSPDGQWVGFVENNRTLRKVAITGGPATTVATMDGTTRGAVWMPDDTILFATTASTGLQRVPALGGTVTVLTRPDRTRGEADHLFPETLPNGRGVLFTITAASGGLDSAQVAVLDLASGTQTVLVRGGSHAHYVPTGHLVYIAGGTLRAVSFDLDGRVVRGASVPVLPRLATGPSGVGDFSVAAEGTLAYADAPGVTSLGARMLVWVDRQGREQPIGAPPRQYVHPHVSPDGTRLAVSSADQERDIWVWDLARQTLTRLTFDPAGEGSPVWMPDGKRLIFQSARAGSANVYWQNADGTGDAERLTESSADEQSPTAVSPDGARLVFHEVGSTGSLDLMLLPLGGALSSTDTGSTSPTGASRSPSQDVDAPRPLLQTPFEENNGVISPDGRWLAYESNSSGRLEVYVRPFPDVTEAQWQVSTAGGSKPLWARSGQELFYLAPDGALTAVRVDARGPTWSAGASDRILKEGYWADTRGRTYDVSPDGQRFLMIKPTGNDEAASPPQIVVVKNWTEELRRLVPPR